MPRELEAKLKRSAKKKGFKGKRADRYVYGALNNMGHMRGSEMTDRGREAELHEMRRKAEALARERRRSRDED